MIVETSHCGVSTCFLCYSENKCIIRRKIFGDYDDYSPKMFIFAKNLELCICMNMTIGGVSLSIHLL